MVHIMQKKSCHLKPINQIIQELNQIGKNFINIIDYNFGVSKEHVLNVCKAIENSNATGWMAETCIEFLDDDEILSALQKSECRMIYCGLETLEQEALSSIHKMNTNIIDNYERIIRKAQKFNVFIASGVIFGLKGTQSTTFEKQLDFHIRFGTIYTKLTFLTYNPGTKVAKNMAKKGDFPYKNKYEFYDGNHMSYVPHGVSKSVVLDGFQSYVNKFYGLFGIFKRINQHRISIYRKMEYFLFNRYYS